MESDGGEDHNRWDRDGIFSNTSWFYARYRPGYPDKVFEILRDYFSLNGSQKVLDLGCGTGQIALKIAPLVNEILAVDPQDGMLQEGISLSDKSGIGNVRWHKGDSTIMASLLAEYGMIDLAIIARAFHWMDRKQVLSDLYEFIKSGGGVAIIGDSPLGRARPRWWQVIDEVVKHWLGEERKAGTKGTYKHPTKRHEDVLGESPFHELIVETVCQERCWDIEKIIGYLYSTSYCSLPLIGDNRQSFEKHLTRRLMELNPRGEFYEDVTVEIMMVFK